MLPGLLHLRCACAVLAMLSYRLLFHSERALSIGALLLALVCAASLGALLGDAAAFLPSLPLAPAADPHCASDPGDNNITPPDVLHEAAVALSWLRTTWAETFWPNV